jgi:hypothetical protein
MNHAAPPVVPPEPPRLWLRLRVPALGLALLGAAAMLAVPLLRGIVPRLTEEQVRSTVLTTLETEVPERFLVTGALEIGTASRSERTTQFLPGLLNMEVGRTTVVVRVPGRASYGFDLRDLRPENIRYTADRVVEVDLPPLRVYAAEVRTEEAEIEVASDRWQRLSREPERDGVRDALRNARPALLRQAEAHLASSQQPRINTARALQAMLDAPLRAAGEENVRFRFVLAPGDTLDLGAEGSRRVVPARP